MKFHLDEHINPAVAEALTRRGIDVTTTRDARLGGKPDLAHITYARKNKRVIVTSDSDFLAIAASGVPHAGIVFCGPHCKSIRNIIESLLLIDACLDPSAMQNHIEYL